ncbi:MAG: D-tyrosyl-tRNA(Tyr) deacylase [Dehalococcoidia bacterium]|nr:D-tyrosyl-tRNA(Tyr) deacylase [Dehalococcoidia bacterium]MCK4580008.1 D-tyrosyl-tRNA(Tyr) deacylase [Dehalococcoidia bacterium]
MKALVQRVARAAVSVNGERTGQIGRGLVVFLGVGRDDSEEEARYLASKVANLRIFPSEAGEFDLSVLETKGEVLIVSQFTLLADSRKGRRPSFIDAAPPDRAKELYESFVEQIRSTDLKVETGIFQEHMLVDIQNDGPVTLLVESRSK